MSGRGDNDGDPAGRPAGGKGKEKERVDQSASTRPSRSSRASRQHEEIEPDPNVMAGLESFRFGNPLRSTDDDEEAENNGSPPSVPLPIGPEDVELDRIVAEGFEALKFRERPPSEEELEAIGKRPGDELGKLDWMAIMSLRQSVTDAEIMAAQRAAGASLVTNPKTGGTVDTGDLVEARNRVRRPEAGLNPYGRAALDPAAVARRREEEARVNRDLEQRNEDDIRDAYYKGRGERRGSIPSLIPDHLADKLAHDAGKRAARLKARETGSRHLPEDLPHMPLISSRRRSSGGGSETPPTSSGTATRRSSVADAGPSRQSSGEDGASGRAASVRGLLRLIRYPASKSWLREGKALPPVPPLPSLPNLEEGSSERPRSRAETSPDLPRVSDMAPNWYLSRRGATLPVMPSDASLGSHSSAGRSLHSSMRSRGDSGEPLLRRSIDSDSSSVADPSGGGSSSERLLPPAPDDNGED